MSDRKPDYRKAYWQHGIMLSSKIDSRGNHNGDCPFCGKAGKFAVNADTGQFKCWSCESDGTKGNLITFLRKVHRLALESTTTDDYRKLKELRPGLMWKMLKDEGVALSPFNDKWLIPIRNGEGKITNLEMWCPVEQGNIVATATCKRHFQGLDHLDDEGSTLIVEGRWDYYAMKWLIRENNILARLLGAPSSSTFPLDDLEGHSLDEVVLYYDHDSSGKSGLESAASKLLNRTQPPRTIKVLRWIDSLPDGYDLRDFCRDNDKKPKTAWRNLQELTTDYQISGVKNVKRVKRDRFEEVLKDFSEQKINIHKGFLDALAISMAVAFSVRVPGLPLWVFLVGPASCGKSTLLSAFQGSNQYSHTIDKFTSKTLVTGWKTPDGRDTSLLPQLNGKLVVVSDYTTTRKLPDSQQQELYGTLQRIYDGKFSAQYGNAEVRDYDLIRFGMLAGVTNIIHGDSRASIGERFLKLEFLDDDYDKEELIRAAMRNADEMDEIVENLQRSVLGFLDNAFSVNDLPIIPRWMEDRIVALCQVVASLRASVDIDRSGVMKYRPEAETGTRVAVQLKRTAQCLAFVHGEPKVTKREYRLIEKLALDSMVEFNLEIAQHLAKSKIPLTTETLSDKINVHTRTVSRHLGEMRDLNVVQCDRGANHTDKKGKTRGLWKLSDYMLELWNRSFHDSHESKRIRKVHGI